MSAGRYCHPLEGFTALVPGDSTGAEPRNGTSAAGAYQATAWLHFGGSAENASKVQNKDLARSRSEPSPFRKERQ